MLVEDQCTLYPVFFELNVYDYQCSHAESEELDSDNNRYYYQVKFLPDPVCMSIYFGRLITGIDLVSFNMGLHS